MLQEAKLVLEAKMQDFQSSDRSPQAALPLIFMFSLTKQIIPTLKKYYLIICLILLRILLNCLLQAGTLTRFKKQYYNKNIINE